MQSNSLLNKNSRYFQLTCDSTTNSNFDHKNVGKSLKWNNLLTKYHRLIILQWLFSRTLALRSKRSWRKRSASPATSRTTESSRSASTSSSQSSWGVRTSSLNEHPKTEETLTSRVTRLAFLLKIFWCLGLIIIFVFLSLHYSCGICIIS